MVQQVKAFAANPAGWSLTFRTHVEGRGMTPASCLMISTGVLWHAYPPHTMCPLTITVVMFYLLQGSSEPVVSAACSREL